MLCFASWIIDFVIIALLIETVRRNYIMLKHSTKHVVSALYNWLACNQIVKWYRATISLFHIYEFFSL